MRAFYGNRISENITETPEGFLVCLGVPIARTGWQEYQRSEIGLDGDGDIRVFRDPDEVFSPATIASFEGKSVTHPHPPEWVTQYNESAYGRGHAQNVRQGIRATRGDDKSDLLLADLVIKDATLISQVKTGLREISCGYDCEYVELQDGKGYTQTQIRGNHVAIVATGRAGERVAIRDQSPDKNTDKRRSGMFKKLGEILKSWAKDADPEDVAAVFRGKALDDDDTKHKDDCDCASCKKARDDKKKKHKDDDDDDFKHVTDTILDRLDRIEQRLTPKAEDALDNLISDLEKGSKRAKDDDDDDKRKAKDDDDDDDKKKAKDDDDDDKKKAKDDDDDDKKRASDVIEPDPVLPEGDRPKNPIPGADSRAVIDYVRAMKPIIAAMKDEKAKKKAIDALKTLLMPAKDNRKSYADLANPKDALNLMPMMDKASQKQAREDENYGKNIMAKYHRKPMAK